MAWVSGVYAQLGKFIQGATKQKLLQTKEQRGVVSVVKINRSHPDYCKHTPVPENRKKKFVEKAAVPVAASGAASAGPAAPAEEAAQKGTQTAVGTAASTSGRSTGCMIIGVSARAFVCMAVFRMAVRVTFIRQGLVFLLLHIYAFASLLFGLWSS